MVIMVINNDVQYKLKFIKIFNDKAMLTRKSNSHSLSYIYDYGMGFVQEVSNLNFGLII